VQSVFLNAGPPWPALAKNKKSSALALAFGVLIVAHIIAGSLWIMDHLNRNMLPMHQVMQMQR
jgi:hypothetical protein